MEVKQVKTKGVDGIPSRILHAEYYSKLNESGNSNDVPTIICLPGGPGGDSISYREDVESFQEYANVILMDPRGCGQSEDCTEPEFHMDFYVEDIETVRNYFNLNKWVVLGTSYGSMTAIKYAIKYGRYLAGLILINGSVSSRWVDLARKSVKLLGTQEQVKMFEALLAGEIITAELLTQFYLVMRPLYTTQEEYKDSKKVEKDISAQILTAGIGEGGFIRDFDFTDELETITAKTLILVGDSDWITPVECIKPAADKIMQSEMHILPNSSHMLWSDCPEQYYGLIKKFCLELV